MRNMLAEPNLYRTLFDNMRDGAMLVQPDGTLLALNRMARETLGYGDETPTDIAALFSQPDQIAELMTQCVDAKAEAPVSLRGQDGHVCRCHLSLHPHRDDNGRLTHYVGMMQPAQLDTVWQSSADTMRVIKQISDTLHYAQDFETVVDEAIAAIVRYTQAPAVALFMVDQATETLQMMGSVGFEEKTLAVGAMLPLHGSLSGLTVARGEIVTSDDLRSDNRLEQQVQQALTAQGLTYVASLPLLYQGQAIGVMNLIFTEVAEMSAEARDTLLAIGQTIGLAMNNTRHLAELEAQIAQRQAAEAQLAARAAYESKLAAFSRTLLTNDETAVSTALTHLREAANASRAYIFENFLDDAHQLCMRPTHESCAPHVPAQINNPILQQFPYSQGLTRWQEQLSQGKLISGKITDFPAAEQQVLQQQEVLSLLILPIMVNGAWYGFIGLNDTEQMHVWQEDDLLLLRTSANILGAYIERVQAKAELQAQQLFLRQVVDLNPEFVFVKDRDGRFLLANEAFAGIYGVTPEQLVGKTDSDFKSDPAQVERFLAEDMAVMENCQPSYTPEAAVTFPDGSVRWLQTAKRPILDENGVATAVLALSVDITERKKAEDALREREQFLRLVMDNIPQAIFWKNKQSVYLGCNTAFAKVVGMTPDDIVGRTDYDMPWSQDQADTYRQDDARVMTSGKPQLNIIEPQKQANDVQAWVETSRIPLHNLQGKLFGILGTFSDITDRIEMQQEIEHSLERRSREIELSTQIAQSIASATNLQELYERVVQEVKERFGYYHVQLLRYDPALETVALVVGYGSAGEKMLAMNHSLPLGVGIIGTAALEGCSIMRPDITNDPNWQSNPLLPRTQGELAVPITMGNRVLGVLDVQSDQANALSQRDQLVLEGLCGQIAIAIETTNLQQDMQTRIRELNLLQRQLSREAWQAYRSERQLMGYQFDQAGVQRLTAVPNVHKLLENAALPNGRQNGHSEQTSAAADHVMMQEIDIRGQSVALLGIQNTPDNPLTPEEVAFLTAVADELGEALEAARLFEETQLALTEQERLAFELETVAQVSTAASTILEIDQLLQSVVDLTKASFDLYHTHIYLLNERGDKLMLKAGAGNVGRLMSLEGRDISLQAESIVARAARQRQGLIVNDVKKTADFLPHPLLPQTRSEMAIPMTVGDQLIGVLDLQSEKVDAFTEEDLKIQTTLAAQIAVAAANARLYAEQVETAKKLRALDQLKSEFLASMSHELRTPLNSIIGFADVLLEGLDGELNERMEEDVRLIRESGRHLRELIGDILDMSKIEAGRMELRYEDVNLRQLAQDVVATAHPLAQEKNLYLNLELDERIEPVRADRTRMRQILWNIMGNAIKFTEKGGVTLKMQRRAEHILVSIRDTGIGIKPEHIPIVFEQFRQIDGGLNRTASGTGLGMPITKKLVELHGGDIWIESVEGQGSTFFFTIPIDPPRRHSEAA